MVKSTRVLNLRYHLTEVLVGNVSCIDAYLCKDLKISK